MVTPDNGQPDFESAISVWGGDELMPGHWTYVRYDPDEPDHCDVDKDRLAKEFGSRSQGGRRLTIPTVVSDEWTKSVVVDASPQPEPVPTPISDGLVEGLSKLADLHAAGTLSDAEFAEAKSRLLSQSNPGSA
ncbi:MAG TPA: SHOCT domain-containing protein [Acidimicrobiales bacterium]|jgi:hypothetical protein|nr:SHOCT domain-containing protein [Acidimicrobiales bacterium]